MSSKIKRWNSLVSHQRADDRLLLISSVGRRANSISIYSTARTDDNVSTFARRWFIHEAILNNLMSALNSRYVLSLVKWHKYRSSRSPVLASQCDL